MVHTSYLEILPHLLLLGPQAILVGCKFGNLGLKSATFFFLLGIDGLQLVFVAVELFFKESAKRTRLSGCGGQEASALTSSLAKCAVSPLCGRRCGRSLCLHYYFTLINAVLYCLTLHHTPLTFVPLTYTIPPRISLALEVF